MRSLTASLLALAAASLASGCQPFIASITSPSDWVSGSSTSIAGSSEGFSQSSSGSDAGAAVAYLADVRLLSAELAAAGGDGEALARELARVAATHGVVDWAGEAGALRAVGAGLRGGGVERSALASWLAGLGAEGEAELAEGFETAGL